MTELYLTRGLPGSGKTTYARTFVSQDPESRVRVSRDDLRMMLFSKKVGLTFQQEMEVTTASQALVRQGLQNGKLVIVDDMHLRPKYIKAWYQIALEEGASDVFTVDLWESLPTLFKRNASRPWEDTVPPDVVQTLYQKFTRKDAFLPVETFWEYKKNQSQKSGTVVPYVRDESKPYSAVIFDLDGTLAHNTNGRGWYDWSRVGEDVPHPEVLELALVLQKQGMPLIFLSGRDAVCRAATQNWLDSHGLRGELYMRPEGDQRSDTVVKYELFDKHLRNHSVWFVVDDRPSVCRMWRDLGLKVFQVGDPHIEF